MFYYFIFTALVNLLSLLYSDYIYFKWVYCFEFFPITYNAATGGNIEVLVTFAFNHSRYF